MRAMLLLLAAVACGRLRFEPLGDASASDRDVGAGADTPPPMFAYVQNATTTGASGATTFAVAVPSVVEGDALIVAFDYDPGPNAFASAVTDSLATTYAVVVGPANNGPRNNYLAYGIVPASGNDTVTVQLTASSGISYELRVVEMAGLAATNAFDVGSYASGNMTGTDAIDSGVFTTTGPNELIYGFEDGDVDAVAGTGFVTASAFDGDLCEYGYAQTAGSYHATETATTGTEWIMLAATFRGR